MNYIIAWFCSGIIVGVIISLHKFFIDHDDITLEDIVLCILCTLIWPFILVMYVYELIGDNKDKIIFKAKRK